MARIAAFLVAICMVLIAAAVGALLYLQFGLSMIEATVVALVGLTGLALYNSVTSRVRDRTDVGDQIADISRGSADLARQTAEIARRLAALEARVDAVADRAHAATDPLAAEMSELGSLMRQLAETVAVHDIALKARPPAPAAMAPSAALPVAAAETPTAPESHAAVASLPDENLGEIVRGAVEAGRIDLYLQPIVTLPQRKVRYYEAISRLRTEEGDVVPAAEFLGPAEKAGLMPRIDALLLFRSVQVVRRLLLKNREIGLFCNLSPSTLAGGGAFSQLLEFIEANRALAPSLVFEFTQAAMRTMGPIEHESLSALAQRGFRFAVDNVLDLRMEPRDLAERGVRFIKVPAGLLLNRLGAASADIHPADLSDLLARFGIELIAERIESEGMVVDLLDYDVRYGQGFLFSPPRPVRAEALQGIAEPAPPAPVAAPEIRPDQRGLLQLARGFAKRV